MLTIDGSKGEGGGQMLRTSLALSLVTGTPFRLENVRAGRARPGLLRQHLAAVRAAATIGNARVEGDELGSRTLAFWPGTLRGGEHRFSIGSAGSCTLVAQTIWPALLLAPEPATIHIEGGTHNPAAPPFEYLAEIFLPPLRALGAQAELHLERTGFAPVGGGAMVLHTRPARLGSLELLSRGAVRAKEIRVLAARLPPGVVERERSELVRHGWDPSEIAQRSPDSIGPGNMLFARVETDRITEGFAAFGEKGLRAERVAFALVQEVNAYLGHDAPVGPHLADQLLLPLALGQGGVFRTPAPTQHTLTQAEVMAAFLGPRVTFVEEPRGTCRIQVQAAR